MIRIFYLGIILSCLFLTNLEAQTESSNKEVAESLEDYIKENHVDEIEDMVHQFANSKIFLEFLLAEGHSINVDANSIKKRDVNVGSDLDVFVKHFSEHQNFTMIMVPVNIYSQLVYDTLLFSIMEVSDQWLKEKYRYHDLSDKAVKEKLLSTENHDLLAEHMYEQGRTSDAIGLSEVQVQLNESYISSSSVHMHMSDLNKQEKKEFRKSWSFVKKTFAHDIELNVEMNIYVFGTDDMRLLYYAKGEESELKITPRNIFPRHTFQTN